VTRRSAWTSADATGEGGSSAGGVAQPLVTRGVGIETNDTQNRSERFIVPHDTRRIPVPHPWLRRRGGIWLDNESARKALSSPGAGAQTEALARRASSRTSLDADAFQPIACPVCGVGLRRIVVSREEVRLDVCAEHGTWFDRYELGLVLQASRSPAPPPATGYHGPTPDFRAGANPELSQLGSIFATGAGALAGAAALALASVPDRSRG
jgi:Zn-finger nucleic acid-binding protein